MDDEEGDRPCMWHFYYIIKTRFLILSLFFAEKEEKKKEEKKESEDEDMGFGLFD